MSVIDDIRASLDAIGFGQQVCLYVFLASYPLTLGRLVETRGRRAAGIAAGISMGGFVFLTDPWMHGALIAVALLAGMGAFIAAVWLLDQLPRWMARPRMLSQWEVQGAPVQIDTARERDGVRQPKLPLTGRAGTT